MTEKALLVQEKDADSSDLTDVLAAMNYRGIQVVKKHEDFVRHACRYEPDIVLIDVRRPANALLNMIAKLVSQRPVPVVMFVEESSDNMISDVIKCGVSAYIVDGYQRNRVRGIIDVARARFDEKQELLKELDDAKSALGGRKLIERAKGIVMKQKNCDEDMAYQLIRKMAMDKNMRIVDIAKQLIELVDLMQ